MPLDPLAPLGTPGGPCERFFGAAKCGEAERVAAGTEVEDLGGDGSVSESCPV